MNKQEENFMEMLEGYKKGEWTLDEAINILSLIEDETLQEQAKDFSGKIGYIKAKLVGLNMFLEGHTTINIQDILEELQTIEEKYCPEEEEKK